jgi:zinc/manganese transport system substrate-binding protein
MIRTATLAVLLLAGTAGLARAEPALDVVASFSILGDMVARVGGDRVAVHVIVGPDGDAHVYQPTPMDAKAVAGADVVVVNGLGFEGFLSRLLESAEYRGPVVTAAADVTPIAWTGEEEHEEHGAEAAHEAHAEGDHDHEAVDPHAWQNAGNGALYARAIARGLCAADAAGCATYEANAAAYAGELEALDADIRARIALVPPERRKVITSHDAFGYFGAAYGVTFLSPQGISTDAEAGAADVASLIRQIRETGVKTLFVENISDSRLIEQIGAETGATLGGVLYSDALSGQDAAAATYLGLMRHNADALVSAMASGS